MSFYIDCFPNKNKNVSFHRILKLSNLDYVITLMILFCRRLWDYHIRWLSRHHLHNNVVQKPLPSIHRLVSIWNVRARGCTGDVTLGLEIRVTLFIAIPSKDCSSGIMKSFDLIFFLRSMILKYLCTCLLCT